MFKRRKWLLWLIIGLVILTGYIFLRARAAVQTMTPQYVTDHAQMGDVVVVVSGTSHLEPEHSRSVNAQVTGEVGTVLVTEGDRVEAGEPLLLLQNDELEFQHERNQLDLQSARLSLRETLGIGPDDPLPADVMAATTITLPSGGRLCDLRVSEGDRVTPGMFIAEVVDDARAHLTVRITPTEAEWVQVGDEATVYFHQFTGTYTGEVTEVDPEPLPEDQAAMGTMTVLVDNPAGLLTPGHTADVNLADGKIKRRAEVVDPPRTTIYAEVGGTVQGLFVREGQLVREGGALLTLSSPSYSLAVTQQLVRIQGAELAVRRSRQNLDDLTITAPIAGEVSSVEVKQDDSVTAGIPLVTVSDYASMRITLEVDELEVSPLETGLQAQVTPEALPHLKMTGEVVSISPTALIQGGVATYPAEIIVTPHPGVRDGMSAKVEIEVQRKTGVLVVPAEAVITSDEESTVRVITETGIELRTVETGLSDGVRTEILSGLEEGEEVVIASVSRDMFPMFGPRM
ncbi:MAG: efflux RND transporter periplasmic adaptor subunit [Bacillota bacterium]